VAMMYSDKIGYGPTVGDALTGLFGPGAAANAAGIAPTDSGAPASSPPGGAPPANPPPPANAVAPAPSAAVSLSPAKSAALKDVETAMGAARDAQKSGDFAAYGAALQRLDDAINKYNNAK
jgi:uncharacterized membrane protein (UPF0182 family)